MNKTICKTFHVVDVDLQWYDMIIGCNLILTLGLEIKGDDLSIKWEDSAIPWRDMDSKVEDAYFIDDLFTNSPVEQEMQRITEILDTKYKKAYLKKIVDAAVNLSPAERGHSILYFKYMKIYSTARSVDSPGNRTI